MDAGSDARGIVTVQPDDLTLALLFSHGRVAELKDASQEALEASQGTKDDLDALDVRVRRLWERIEAGGTTGVGSAALPPTTKPRTDTGVRLPVHSFGIRVVPPAKRIEWSEVCHAARESFEARAPGAKFNLDDLLDPAEVRRIEARFTGQLSISTRLDRYDLVAAVAAGLTAGILDCLAVRIPRDFTHLDEYAHTGSLLTAWIRSVGESDPVARWARSLEQTNKVAFDHVSNLGVEIAGFGGRTHRLQALGHDPLAGLVIGTWDVMRGGLTAVGKDGKLVLVQGLDSPVTHPLEALTRTVRHMLSDLPTHMGIPAPGFALLQAAQGGRFGEQDHTAAELARFMYMNGYDARHFLTMSTSAAAAEAVLRCYIGIRRSLDEEYASGLVRAPDGVTPEPIGAQPRFVGMAFVAHLVGSALNAGRVVAYQGNPLAINYAQWLVFLQRAVQFIQTRRVRDMDRVVQQIRFNAKDLLKGWPDLGVEEDGFPMVEDGASTANGPDEDTPIS